jgi:EmrB/QacA subfamily drug resistance transporter
VTQAGAAPHSKSTAAVREFIPWTPERVRWTAGLMLALLIAAMDSTVVGTALPTIGGELGNFSLYPWVFSGYLLTATTTVPLWGRLADLYGRKRVLMAGMAIFVGASVLCGSAHSMLALVLFRGLQGIGAGCLQPVTLTVVGDMFPMAQRARIQGLFSGMWAVASVIGPIMGAVFVSSIGWRWIFDVNVPVGLASAMLLWSFHDRPTARRASVDYPGAVLLTAGVAMLLFGFGSGSGGGQPQWPLIAGAVVVLVLFMLVERRTESPTVPLRFLSDPVIGPAILVAIVAGTLLFGLTSYIPFYVQGGLGGTPYQAGAALAPLLFGWSIVGIVAGRFMIRVGYQRLALAGTVMMLCGSAMLLLHPLIDPVVWVGVCTLVIGAGMGTLNTPLLIMIQSVVGWEDRGAVTALNQFSRTIGGAVGVALMGILLESRIHAGAVAHGLDPQTYSDPLRFTINATAQSGAGRALVTSGVQALEWVFVGLSAVALVIAIGIVLNRANRGRLTT